MSLTFIAAVETVTNAREANLRDTVGQHSSGLAEKAQTRLQIDLHSQARTSIGRAMLERTSRLFAVALQ